MRGLGKDSPTHAMHSCSTPQRPPRAHVLL